jgi:glycosyltransferase involved in cell wall biosynthesis
MNIALLSAGFSTKGMEATQLTVLGLAQQYGRHNVCIITEQKRGFPAEEVVQGIPIYRQAGWQSKGKVAKLWNTLMTYPQGIKKIGHVDIIHSFSSAPALVARSLLARRYHKQAKVVHTLKSYSRAQGGNRFFRLLNRADVITVPTQVFKEKLVQRGCKEEKIKVIRSNIDTKKFIPRNREMLKQKYGYVGKKIVFHYGGMWSYKGTETLISAIKDVEGENIIFLFAPRHPIPEYERRMHDMQSTHTFKILNDGMPIEDYVAMADVVVLPYDSMLGTEGNPSCLLEAMACKTQVITSDLPELREIAAGCVRFVPAKNVQELAVVISHAVAYPNEVMIETAYRRAQMFATERIAQQYVQVYEGLLL